MHFQIYFKRKKIFRIHYYLPINSDIIVSIIYCTGDRNPLSNDRLSSNADMLQQSENLNEK